MIFTFIKRLHNYLDSCFDGEGLAWKNSTDPASGSQVNKPEIYDFLMPSTALNEGYPDRCPALVLTVDSRAENVYTISIHTCVSYSSIADAEKVVKTGANKYKFNTGDSYDTGSEIELYKSSLLMTEHVYNACCRLNNFGVKNVSAEMPSTELDAFPYCTSVVKLEVELNPGKISQNSLHDLY